MWPGARRDRAGSCGCSKCDRHHGPCSPGTPSYPPHPGTASLRSPGEIGSEKGDSVEQSPSQNRVRSVEIIKNPEIRRLVQVKS